jgi:hypothetical protein
VLANTTDAICPAALLDIGMDGVAGEPATTC